MEIGGQEKETWLSGSLGLDLGARCFARVWPEAVFIDNDGVLIGKFPQVAFGHASMTIGRLT